MRKRLITFPHFFIFIVVFIKKKINNKIIITIMSLYLKKFENHTEYEEARQNLILPNVSYCVNENEVHYNPYDPYAGHEYVEIGGLKWATMNIGANSITDDGLYFQWGDTQGYTADQVGSGAGKKYFGWADYKYWTGDTGSGSSGMTKYNSTDGKTVLDASDDAAQANWGGNWRMPTKAEFDSLLSATSNEWTTVNGVNGRLFTDKTDGSKKLFFPAVGLCNNGSVYSVGSDGNYWSSSLYTSYVVYGWYLSFGSGDSYMDYNDRCYGFPVRGVVC